MGIKALGWGLIIFAVVQAYLWLFEAISVTGTGREVFYFLIICIEFVCGLLAAKIIKGI